MRTLAWMVVVGLIAPSAGCLGSRYDFVADAADARTIDGYSYDGARVRRAQGTLSVEVDTVKDRGRIEAHVEDGLKRYDVVFNRFFGDEVYQDGGIHRDFTEHGDTGNGSTELPAFHAYLAAWGSATMRFNGAKWNDPTTLREDWTAHLMMPRGHVRDANTGVVYKSDGRTPYDPATPGDAIVNRTGAQAILQLKTAANDLYYHFEFEVVRLKKY